ncbi:unnamed protein product [Phytomonas sp. EM1]|nr:unnamed protein product [Phytomonas sp. EM1]|eukprot:CCW60053.1 unnamed protein product [Phytomonas sp. isolate EM1]
MSSDQLKDFYNRLHSDLANVERKSEDEITIDDYKGIHDEFTRLLKTLDVCDNQEAAYTTEKSIEELDDDLQRLSSGCSELQLSAMSECVATASCIESSLISNFKRDIPDDARGFQMVATQVAELRAQLIVAQIVLKALLSKSIEDISEGRFLTTDIHYAQTETWDAKEEQLVQLLNSLRLKASAKGIPLDTEEQLMTEVRCLAKEAIEHVQQGLQQRKARDEQLISFFKECSKLILWCRKQISNLEALQEPDHIQAFCATLAESYKTMSSNFAVLVQNVYPYVRANHQPVRQALEEANELWYYLLVFAFERLSKTLLEIHPKSPLDVQVDKYAAYPRHVLSFLDALEEFFDDVSTKKVLFAEDIPGLCARCDEVRMIIQKHESSLVDGAHRFAVRARAMRNAYTFLREALLTRLTFLSSTADIVINSKRRQHEFEECVRELKSWAADQAHGESWRDIYSKIVEIKRMIERENENIECRKVATDTQ